jgi:hypothetical protein
MKFMIIIFLGCEFKMFKMSLICDVFKPNMDFLNER